MIAIRGFHSSLAQQFKEFVPKWDEAVEVPRGQCNVAAHRHLFAQGVISSTATVDRTGADIKESLMVNAGTIIWQCERIIEQNDLARICIVGSESGITGSFDRIYAAAKAAVHSYVCTRRLRTPHQQLVCIAPSIIGDSGMTLRRHDRDRLETRQREHPKRRFLRMSEVNRLIYYLLYVDDGYTSNTVVRMNGGQHT